MRGQGAPSVDFGAKKKIRYRMKLKCQGICIFTEIDRICFQPLGRICILYFFYLFFFMHFVLFSILYFFMSAVSMRTYRIIYAGVRMRVKLNWGLSERWGCRVDVDNNLKGTIR